MSAILRSRYWVLALLVGVLLSSPVSADRTFVQSDVNPDFSEVSRGVQYAHMPVYDGPWSIHIVRIDRDDKGLQFVSALAKGTVYGLATVKQQVQSLPESLGRPIVATNADFFIIRPGLYQGDPTGMHIVEGEMVSGPIGSGFWIDPEGKPHIAEVYPRFRVEGPNGFDVKIGFNQGRSDDKAVLYAPSMGASTHTEGGVELILARNEQEPWLPLKAGQQYRARVTAVHENGDCPIEADSMVLSLGPGLAREVNVPAEGSILTISTQTSPNLDGVRTAIGGGAILVKDGKAQTWSGNLPRHPRTMIGWGPEYYYLVVVDGRQYGLSIGMSYPEQAEMMLGLGCTEAMNLDGGGSSTLWVLGQIKNSPSDRRERAVANSLIVVDTKSENELPN